MDRCAAGMFRFSQITTVRDYLNQGLKRKKCCFLANRPPDLSKIADYEEKNWISCQFKRQLNEKKLAGYCRGRQRLYYGVVVYLHCASLNQSRICCQTTEASKLIFIKLCKFTQKNWTWHVFFQVYSEKITHSAPLNAFQPLINQIVSPALFHMFQISLVVIFI